MNTFADVIGHEDMVMHLQTSLQMNKLSHAYIFAGEDGIGKNYVADIFAAAIQCDEKKGNPCGVCKSCLQAMSGNHPDIRRVLHEKAGIGVDDIRLQLNNDIQVKPYSSSYKIYIIDEAEKMTEQAQNALLKTIEEPPEYAVIILLTNNVNAFLPTILSRCVTLNFKSVDTKEIQKYLMENAHIPDYQAEISAAFACGNLGKALKYASSETFTQLKSDIIHFMKNIEEMDVASISDAVKYLSDNKAQVNDCLDLMMLWYRDILMFKATKDANLLLYKDELQDISRQAEVIDFEHLNHIMDSFSTVKTRLNANVNFDMAMELLLLSVSES